MFLLQHLCLEPNKEQSHRSLMRGDTTLDSCLQEGLCAKRNVRQKRSPKCRHKKKLAKKSPTCRHKRGHQLVTKMSPPKNEVTKEATNMSPREKCYQRGYEHVPQHDGKTGWPKRCSRAHVTNRLVDALRSQCSGGIAGKQNHARLMHLGAWPTNKKHFLPCRSLLKLAAPLPLAVPKKGIQGETNNELVPRCQPRTHQAKRAAIHTPGGPPAAITMEVPSFEKFAVGETRTPQRNLLFCGKAATRVCWHVDSRRAKFEDKRQDLRILPGDSSFFCSDGSNFTKKCSGLHTKWDAVLLSIH